MTEPTNTLPDPEIIQKLLAQRDFHAAIVQEAFKSDPPKAFGDHDVLARLFFTAAETIRRLLEQNAAMQATLRSRAAQAVLDATNQPYLPFLDDPPALSSVVTLEPASEADPDTVTVTHAAMQEGPIA